MTYHIRVPATTANLGPGFDALGLALKLYNEFRIETIESGIEMLGCDDIPLGENLIYTTIQRLFHEYHHEKYGVRVISHKIDIPLSRGLGSSAACIAAGIVIANRAMGERLGLEDMIRIGTELEGHPDNIVPALVGGMVASIHEGDQVIYTRISIPQSLCFALMIPEFTVSTGEARKVLPDHYSKKDCIFNISRTALLVAAMQNGELEKLRVATGDRIHQPYRMGLIPGLEAIFQKAQALGSKTEVISGSGSTLMAMIERNNIRFEDEMNDFLSAMEGGWYVKILEHDQEGIQIYE
ncbi:homoserine kinase [Anaerosolibacter carboniphilus]|uniref:Homoserine kinase n=1 Tax=Anaerosolibacter carboniphilus TaxID=1417629 RepID=A0A841L4R8_9FIRM|nr:homoserine kinase [Anaerosolibacter carboniphilus]MBB6217399.1 homoserine kinase [Anaerosolibacter carboniphilus]